MSDINTPKRWPLSVIATITGAVLTVAVTWGAIGVRLSETEKHNEVQDVSIQQIQGRLNQLSEANASMKATLDGTARDVSDIKSDVRTLLRQGHVNP